jgi:hypothetical protein
MPLLVAVWQNKITARYNIVEEGTADVEGIGELKLVSNRSLFFAHSSPLTVPRVAIEPSGVIFDCSQLPASRSLLPVPAPVITCYFGESNPKLSIKSVCCAIGPCICPVFTGITVSQ